MRHTLLFLLPTLLLSTATLADNVDSGWLRPYVNGRGLAFEYSSDSLHWQSLGHGRTFVDSDFGTWGAEKKMADPCLYQDAEGMWQLLWIPNPKYDLYAVCSSADLIHWKPQDYPTLTPEVEQLMKEKRQATIRVPWSVIERLCQRSDYLEARDKRFSESLRQDDVRFPRLEPVDFGLTFDVNASKAISDKLIGVFFEDISYGADGGLYAELIQNRDFEYTPGENRHDRSWGPMKGWEVDGVGDSSQWLSTSIATDDPIHLNNPHYLVVTRGNGKSYLTNKGYDRMTIRWKETYDFSFFTRKAPGQKNAVRLKIRLESTDGHAFGEKTIKVSHSQWKKQTLSITSDGYDSESRLVIEPLDPGTVHLDMISLFPRHTFHNRPNGLRADVAQAIADIHPKFVRFPGGCVAHGDGLDNMYQWKKTIGRLEERSPMRNIWNYHQSFGLGYYEYFQFCEDIGAEPLPVLPAGVPCQNSSDGGPGQQGGLPFGPQADGQLTMEQYTQDVLDLIEWANGDAKTTKWGKVRAESGHPKPFNLKYIGIGNEDLISDVFTERFTYIYNKVHERYPDIIVCGTVGPFYEGSDYEWGWKLATDLGVPMVDEHYYVSPGWMLHNQDFYDHYDRTKPHVYLGEYAAHAQGRRNCVESALCEALYLTNVERNADVVEMTSYAPLLCREGHSNWDPDMIYFNSGWVSLTPGYYVQQLFGTYCGNRYIPSTFDGGHMNDDVRRRISVSCVSNDDGDIILKLANLLPAPATAHVDLPSLGLSEGQPCERVTLQGQPDDVKAKPEQTDDTLSSLITLPPYSFSVICIRSQQ